MLTIIIMEENNRKIAKNTLINYANLFLSMVIGLFASRYVLMALGASDYGLYNVVGGIISLFAFISGALSSTTIRFVNYELGKTNGNPNRMFNICNVLHIGVALLIFVLAETIGIWYILNFLRVAPGKEADAMFVFQISIITSCLNITNTPYSSLFIAFERFSFPMLVNIGLRIVQLAGTISLVYYEGDALRPYAILMSITSILSFCLYRFYSCHLWPNVTRWKFVRGRSNYFEPLAFNNYSLMQSLAMMLRGQGSVLLVNFFFGTVANAAFAIATSVQNYVNMFVTNFDTAVGPQLTKSVSAGDTPRTTFLVDYTCKICLLLTELILFPLFAELPFILKLWLRDVPAGTEEFTYFILLVTVVGAMSGGLAQYITATGKIKWFRVIYSLLFILCIPLGWVFFKWGVPAYTIVLLFVLSDLIYRIIQLILCYKILGFDSISFIRFAYSKPFFIALIMAVYLLGYSHIAIHSTIAHLVGLVFTFFVGLFIITYLGLNRKERNKIYGVILNKVRNN